jgi:hypothetical protein
MPNRNYRQAKRSRELTRKVKQQQKLERKLNRTATPTTLADPPPASPANGQVELP